MRRRQQVQNKSSIIKQMERTSIFAHSNKLILSTHTDIKCPNCNHYLNQIESLRKTMTQMMQQIQISKPNISDVLQNQGIDKYEEQLLLLKKNYENLQRKLNRLNQENRELLEENQNVVYTNRNLKIQFDNMSREMELCKSRQSYEVEEKERDKENGQKNKIVLTQVTNNSMHKTSRTLKKSEKSDQNFEEYMRERQKIQEKRHEQIQKLTRILKQL